MQQQAVMQEFDIEQLEQRVEFGLCGGGGGSGGGTGGGGGGDGCGTIGDCEDHMVNP